MVIDTKYQYGYTSSSIRPLQVQEYFPMQISLSREVLTNPIICPPPPQNKNAPKIQDLDALLESLDKDFKKQQKSIQKELQKRGIPKELAFYLYLK